MTTNYKIDFVGVNIPLAGPWERWAARTTDFLLESLIIGVSFIFLSEIHLHMYHMENMLMTSIVGYAICFMPTKWGFIIAPFVFLLDSVIYAVFGNTLGKKIWGIKTVDYAGEQITGWRYFYRNIRVYWGGYGLAFPIIILCTFITQYNRAFNGKDATYDTAMKLKTVRINPSKRRTFLGIFVLILIYGVFLLFLAPEALDHILQERRNLNIDIILWGD